MTNPPLIVVVDDDASMNQALERLLCASGWRVLTFPSAEMLLASGTAPQAHAFIFDVQLPGLSGFALHEQLMAANFKMPVIFITAHDRAWALEQSRRVGAIGYFTKPFSGQTLLETLQQHLAAE